MERAQEMEDSVDSDGSNCLDRNECATDGGDMIVTMFAVQMGAQVRALRAGGPWRESNDRAGGEHAGGVPGRVARAGEP